VATFSSRVNEGFVVSHRCENRELMSRVPASGGEQATSKSAVELGAAGGVDLFWLPLGAGGSSVRLNGRVYEALAARLERRPACDLYHSALELHVPEGRFVIEQAPVPDANGAERGVVAEGAVGQRWAGRFRISATRSAVGMTVSFPTSPRQSEAHSE
jgi:hypothetical protein